MNKEYFLIIGASSDVGCEVIRELASENTVVLAHYNKNAEKIEKLKSVSPGEVIPLQADLSSDEQTLNLLEKIRPFGPQISRVLHLSAPRPRNARFKDVKWQEFEADLRVQLKSATLILQEILPKMAQQRAGKIVLMSSSVTTGVPYKNLVPYVTAKYALLGLGKALAAEYADKNIQINSISPSLMETAFLEHTPEKAVEFAAESHPLKRNAQAKDIVPLILFLLSSQGDFITGANIPVTGGLSF